VFFVVFASKSETIIPLDTIKQSLVSFLIERHPIELSDYSSDDLSDFYINDRKKQKPIEEGQEGVFVFSSTLASGFRYHFLLVDKCNFQILNMTEPIDINVLKIIQFFKRNKQYCKEDILFYINDLVITYQRNEENIKSFNGIIR
jgi:hypothetical protein